MPLLLEPENKWLPFDGVHAERSEVLRMTSYKVKWPNPILSEQYLSP